MQMLSQRSEVIPLWCRSRRGSSLCWKRSRRRPRRRGTPGHSNANPKPKHETDNTGKISCGEKSHCKQFRISVCGNVKAFEFCCRSLTRTGGTLLRKKALGITTSIWSFVQMTVSLSSNWKKIGTDYFNYWHKNNCFRESTFVLLHSKHKYFH